MAYWIPPGNRRIHPTLSTYYYPTNIGGLYGNNVEDLLGHYIYHTDYPSRIDYLESAETLPIPESENTPPAENYTIPGYSTENRGPGMSDLSPGLDMKTKANTSGGSGMSKDPRNYIEAAKDIATWTADIVDSSRSKMGLPALRQYHPETIRDVESYGMMKRGPLLGRSLADVDKPRFGSSFLDVNKKSIKGAMDGWNISNNWIGAVVGGVIGAGMGVGNALTKLKTYNENLRRLTRQDKMQTQNFLAGQNTGYRNIRSNVKSSMNRQRLSSNYALGGQIDNEEIMGITKYGAGGTHEENPNGGVQVGIGDNGRPNLVEEGEVRWNDFIFSQRVKPTEEVLRKYNTFMRGGYTSYAELADKILKLHEGRENSPFDRASLQVQMQRLADAQEWQKLADEAAQYGLSPEMYNQYQNAANNSAFGGNIFDEGGPWYNPATRQFVTTYDANNLYLVPVINGRSGNNYFAGYDPNASVFYTNYWNGLDAQAQNELKKEFLQYYLSDNYKPVDLNNRSYNKWTPRDTEHLYKEAINDLWGPAHNAYIDFMYNKIATAPAQQQQEVVTTTPVVEKKSDEVDNSVPRRTPIDYDPTRKDPAYPYYLEAMQYAPVVDSLRSVLEQDPPDYIYANNLASLYRPLSYRPTGTYKRYTPFDIHYTDTAARQQANTLYSQYRNNAQSNAAANFFATMASTAGGNAAADALTRARTYGENMRNAVLEYNNKIDEINEQGRRGINTANVSNFANIFGRSYAAMEEERRLAEEAAEFNKAKLAENIGNLGRGLYDRWRVDNNPYFSYNTRWQYTGNIPVVSVPMTENDYINYMKSKNK